MRSIRDAISVQPTVLPFVATGTTTVATIVNGTTVDSIGFNTALIHAYQQQLIAGVATLVVTLQESADNSTWANANDNSGTVIGFTLVGGTSANVFNTARIEGLGLNRKRYLRGVIAYTLSATTVTATTVATICLGRAYGEPVAVTPGATSVPVSNT